jgi:hypothetical protein
MKNKTQKTNLEHPLYESPVRERNLELYGDSSDSCICCGKRMKEGEREMVHMNTNWMAMDVSIETTEDTIKHGFESQGVFPIGNTCAKKMPKNYIHAK